MNTSKVLGAIVGGMLGVSACATPSDDGVDEVDDSEQVADIEQAAWDDTVKTKATCAWDTWSIYPTRCPLIIGFSKYAYAKVRYTKSISAGTVTASYVWYAACPECSGENPSWRLESVKIGTTQVAGPGGWHAFKADQHELRYAIDITNVTKGTGTGATVTIRYGGTASNPDGWTQTGKVSLN